MTMFMVSLAGVPPTGGFWAKIFIFRAAIDRGGSLGLWLAVIMLMNSVISLFYYFAVPRQMIFKPGIGRVGPLGASWLVTAVVSLAAVALLVVVHPARTRSPAWRTCPRSSTDACRPPAGCQAAVSRTPRGRVSHAAVARWMSRR